MEMSAQTSAVMYMVGVRPAESKEGEVGEGPTVLQMVGGSPFNELLLWPSSTSQPRCVKLRCVLQNPRRER